MKLDSTVSAVVTGGASGLGLASVKALRAVGVKVAIFDLNADAGERMAAETGSVFCQADVLSDESLDAAFAKARLANGQERVLVAAMPRRSSAKIARRRQLRCFRPPSLPASSR